VARKYAFNPPKIRFRLHTKLPTNTTGKSKRPNIPCILGNNGWRKKSPGVVLDLFPNSRTSITEMTAHVQRCRAAVRPWCTEFLRKFVSTDHPEFVDLWCLVARRRAESTKADMHVTRWTMPVACGLRRCRGRAGPFLLTASGARGRRFT
jgi:hypothetical protein